jgi:hypothetical protein
MSHPTDSPSDLVINQFCKNFQLEKSQCAAMIAALEGTLTSVAVCDFFYDLTDELKGILGSQAANMTDTAALQEQAISECEQWVASNLSPEEDMVALTLWLNGPERATAMLHNLAGAAMPLHASS